MPALVARIRVKTELVVRESDGRTLHLVICYLGRRLVSVHVVEDLT